jgi:hypothetical protein
MSSCRPIRCSSRVATAVALCCATVLPASVGTPAVAAQPALHVVQSGAAAGQVRLMVQVPETVGDPIGPDAFTASVQGGALQQARAEPLLSDRLSVGVVVDACDAAAPLLPAGLSGAANFVLAAPSATRGTLVLDTDPPQVAVAWPAGPADLLRGLSGVRSGGIRSTAAALDVALAQLPAEAADPRLVVLYTGAPDAGGEPAAAVVERMRSAGVVLAVVEASGPGPPAGAASKFWTTVAAGTGGTALAATPADVIGAFDRAASTLRRYYVVTLPAPADPSGTVLLRVETGSGTLTGQVALERHTTPAALVAVLIGAVIAAVLGAVILRRRRRRGAKGDPAEPRQIWHMPVRGVRPVERETLLAEMAAGLQAGRPIWLRPDPGVAGLGTTTAMIEFAHRHRTDYDIAWWVPALDPDLVPDCLAQLAEVLGLAAATDPADEAAAALLAALAQRRRWLLVFDDAARPDELARYVPKGPGHVLLASPEAGWGELADPVTVPPFTRAESVTLLRAECSDVTVECADRIAAAMRDVPLAVGPASAALAHTRTDRDATRAVLPDRAGDVDPTTAAWTVLLDGLAADDAAASTLLTLAAWSGPAPLPLSLLAACPETLPEPLAAAARQPSVLAKCTANLRRRGLARVTVDDVALHPVPAALLRARTGQEHAGEGGWAAVAVRLLRTALADRPAAEPGCWPTWRRVVPLVLVATDPARPLEVVADHVGWLLGEAGAYLTARGRTRSARSLLDDAQEYRARSAGESSTPAEQA